jgi:hypothetical protein
MLFMALSGMKKNERCLRCCGMAIMSGFHRAASYEHWERELYRPFI